VAKKVRHFGCGQLDFNPGTNDGLLRTGDEPVNGAIFNFETCRACFAAVTIKFRLRFIERSLAEIAARISSSSFFERATVGEQNASFIWLFRNVRLQLQDYKARGQFSISFAGNFHAGSAVDTRGCLWVFEWQEPRAREQGRQGRPARAGK
jgi:hypothetical protein